MRANSTLLFILLAAAVPAYAVNRVVNIVAPAEAAAGSSVTVTVIASTDVADGEQIGFLHAEYSTDEGMTWTQFFNAEKSGAELSRSGSFSVGAMGVKTLIRARAAFRGGKAGDVDFRGNAIQWGGTWEKWRTPPTKFAIINVSAAPAVPVHAVNRVVKIFAPAEAAAGSNVTVTVLARTDATDGEQIGFLHAEYSADGGKTWVQFYYAEKAGAELSRSVSFSVGAQGVKTLIRARVAFRGGKAGDVDIKGNAVQWGESWEKWRTPLAKFAIIYVSTAAVPVRAVNRVVNIIAPAEAAAGSSVTVTVTARTDAADGEQIGFLHAEYSTDGKTWAQFYYAEKAGAEVSLPLSFSVGAQGVKTLIRARVAFRGGKAGDVDFKGNAIQWGETWEKWRTPPTKFAIIYVTK